MSVIIEFCFYIHSFFLSDAVSLSINGATEMKISRLIRGNLFLLIRLHVFLHPAITNLYESKKGSGHLDMSVVVVFLPQKLNEEYAQTVNESTYSNWSFEL